MANNQLLPFGTAGGANVLDYATYQNASWRLTGFVAGTAVSQQLNTAWRQGSFVAAMIGQFTADYSNQNVNDDGNVPTFETNFVAALGAVVLNNIKSQKSLFNIAQLSYNARTVLSGTGFVNYQTGTYVKKSATSDLIVETSMTLGDGGTGAAAAISKLTFATSSTLQGILMNNQSGQSRAASTAKGRFSGIPAGSFNWTLALGRGDSTAWQSIINPVSTDQSFLPSQTTSTIFFSEIEP